MPHYKPQRCMVCKKFGASMLSEDGKGYLCYKCWYAAWKASHPDGEPPENKASQEKPENSWHMTYLRDILYLVMALCVPAP